MAPRTEARDAGPRFLPAWRNGCKPIDTQDLRIFATIEFGWAAPTGDNVRLAG